MENKVQRILNMALEQMFRIRNACAVGQYLALENEDLAIGAGFSEVVVRTAVAEAELEHGSGQIVDEADRMVEAVALRLQAAQKTVQSAQRAAWT